MSSYTITTRVDGETARKMEDLAQATRRSKSFLAAEAIQAYVEENAWQIEAIREGVKKANEGDFATEAQVNRFFNKWKKNAR